MMRRIFVWAHRYAGLAVAAFLVIEGITGSLLAFNTALEHKLNPQLFAKHRAGHHMSLGALAVRAEKLVPNGRVDYVFDDPDQAMVRMEARGLDQLFLDPWTGAELGRRTFGDLSQGRINIMPFVYNIHAQLAWGPTGTTLLGAVALLWTVDCFVALYVTLPRVRAGFWRRWMMAWRVKSDAGAFRLNFDLHRAGGLWAWVLLLVFAWSSVMLAWPSFYASVTKAVLPYRTDFDVEATALAHPVSPRRLDWLAAENVGRQRLAEVASRHGLTLGKGDSLAYIPAFGVYSYFASSNLDVRGESAGTGVWFDAGSGALREEFLPTRGQAGQTVSSWLWALHYGDVRNNPVYRTAVAIMGLWVAMLSVTGIYIWFAKRRNRTAHLGRPSLS
ncbi:MAG: PepSY domain-containing protein [Candidatus Eremiobacteraeota bacterium]|nr:PepSY domain-containing protein [Candidatus Eremiobacteraeota bacterium]